MTSPRVSLVLSTYEKPRELELALRSLLGAEVGGLDLEVLVADDGSGPETAAVVERLSAGAPFDVLHIRQEDRGFRLAAARNAAIRRSSGDIVVFLDGDSLAHPDCLRQHAARCRPGVAHTGSRCQLDETESAGLIDGSLEIRDTVSHAAHRQRWKRRVGFLKNGFYRLTGLKVRPKLIGGNCSVHRRDLEAVNGFDERFVGWGLEDDDLRQRLRRRGVKIRDGTVDCLVAHLFHLTHPSHRPTVHHTANYRYYNRGGYLSRCRHGLLHRPLTEVGFRFAGEFPAALRPLLDEIGWAAPGETPEVILVPPGASPPALRSPEAAEMVVQLAADILEDADPVTRALQYLEEQV